VAQPAREADDSFALRTVDSPVIQTRRKNHLPILTISARCGFETGLDGAMRVAIPNGAGLAACCARSITRILARACPAAGA